MALHKCAIITKISIIFHTVPSIQIRDSHLDTEPIKQVKRSMPNFQHSGLYFTPDHVQAAHEHLNKEPFKSAWDFLNKHTPTTDSLNDTDLMLHAFHFRLSGNHESGETVSHALQSSYGLDINAYATYFDALAGGITLAHAAELVRDHATFASGLSSWSADYTNFCDQLQHPPETASVIDHIWLGFLNLVSGIVLDADDRFEAGCEAFRHTIAQIRPEGYLPTAVDGGDAASFQRQFLVVSALVCMAEAATHAGVDLWAYNFRGISVTTAAAYITYYYYYPTHWRWATVTDEPIKALFQQGGSFLEMVNHRARPHDLKLLLDEQRPMFNPALGGLTTLTHAVPAKERRGLFG